MQTEVKSRKVKDILNEDSILKKLVNDVLRDLEPITVFTGKGLIFSDQYYPPDQYEAEDYFVRDLIDHYASKKGPKTPRSMVVANGYANSYIKGSFERSNIALIRLMKYLLNKRGITSTTPYDILLKAKKARIISSISDWCKILRNNSCRGPLLTRLGRIKGYIKIVKSTLDKIYNLEIENNDDSIDTLINSEDFQFEKVLGPTLELLKKIPYVEKIYYLKNKEKYLGRTSISILVECPSVRYDSYIPSTIRRLLWNYYGIIIVNSSLLYDDLEVSRSTGETYKGYDIGHKEEWPLSEKIRILLYQKKEFLDYEKSFYLQMTELNKRKIITDYYKPFFEFIYQVSSIQEVYVFETEKKDRVPFVISCSELTSDNIQLIRKIFRTGLAERAIIIYELLSTNSALKKKIDKSKILVYRR